MPQAGTQLNQRTDTETPTHTFRHSLGRIDRQTNKQRCNTLGLLPIHKTDQTVRPFE